MKVVRCGGSKTTESRERGVGEDKVWSPSPLQISAKGLMEEGDSKQRIVVVWWWVLT